MLAASKHLAHLYRGTFLFGLACGISIALTSLYLNGKGFDKEDIGSLALFFASGLVIFALPVGSIIRRFGGKRTLTAALVGYAACVGIFPLLSSYSGIAIVRFFDGMFSVAVWVSAETLLLARTDDENKGHLTSLYAIWLASGYVLGPLLAFGVTQVLSLESAFGIASAFGLAASLYLGALLPEDPSAPPEPKTEAAQLEAEPASSASALALLGRIKTSCFAAFSYGYFQASVVLFLPLFLIESKGVPRDDTIILPGLFCFGMLIFSNIAGRFADRAGHLRVVTGLSVLGTLCVFGFVFLDSYWLMCLAVFGAGATFASMSPVALALVGVVTERRDYGRANSIYNVFYASGMLLGPPLTSLVFSRMGGPAMLYHLGGLWTVFVLFCLAFYGDDPAARRGLVLAPPDATGPAGDS